MESMDTDEELSLFLERAAHDDSYEVECVLKASAYERTELVSLVGRSGSRMGECVRKTIDTASGLGGAYEMLHEAQAAGRRFLHLPRIVSCNRCGDELVVVMEKVVGVSLDQAVLDERAKTADEQRPAHSWVCETFALLCDAVAELHGAFDPPLVHRDLKPENVIVSPGGVTIVDFGTARAHREGTESDTVKFGTRAYAPPEQFGYGQTDVRSDVYALGMVLLFMLTGRTPSPAFAGEGAKASEVDPCLAAVIEKATAFDPKKRYASAEELKLAALAAFARMDRRDARGPLSASEKLGIAWDAVLVLVAAVLVTGCLFAALDPNEYDRQFPVWFRLLEYVGFLSLAFLAAAFTLGDKRFLGRLSLRWRGRTWKSYLPFALKLLGIAVGCFLVSVVLASTVFSYIPPASAL